MDSQERLAIPTDAVPRTVGMLVIGAVIGLVLLRKLNISVST